MDVLKQETNIKVRFRLLCASGLKDAFADLI